MDRLIARFVVVVAWVVLAAAAPRLARAACCVCSGCTNGTPACFTTGGCDIGQCVETCSAASCSSNTFDGDECVEVAQCNFKAPAGGAALYLSLTLLLGTLGIFALRRRSLPTSVRIAAGALVLLATAVGVQAVTQIRLTGTWGFDTSAPVAVGASNAPDKWTANVNVADDGSVSGTVTLPGFANVDVAQVAGTLRNGIVSGTLHDAAGNTIAQFQGTVDGGALHGTFTKVDGGETGTFEWGVSPS